MVALALVVTAAIASWSVLVPPAEPTSAPPTTPSGERAMADLGIVAARPHPVGSAAQRQVRDYLVAEADALGLPVDVQQATVAGVSVENVVVRLPGTENTGRNVLLNAHYDSAEEAPGATDDGVPVVAMLEALRALRAGDPLRNDVVFLFTDGEERSASDGGPGMKAFLAEHPAADRTAVAFVFECLPESSGVTLRSTTRGDAWLVRELGKASLPVFAHSAINASSREWPGTDFAAVASADLLGAGFHAPGDRVRYHNAGDNAGAVDPGVVQDFADTIVALAGHFGALDLDGATASSEDRVYVTVPWLGLVAYPIWWAQVLAVVTAAGFAVVVWAARRRRGLGLARTAVSSGAFLAMCGVGLVLATVAWRLLLELNPESDRTLNSADFEKASTAMAVILAIALAAYVTASHLLARWVGALELAAGALLWSVLGSLVSAFAEPLFSPVTSWMAAGGVLALAVAVFLDPGRWIAGAALALSALPAFFAIVPLLVLEVVDVEDGPTVVVPVLGLVVGTLLVQVLLVTGRLTRTRPHQG